jgi:lysophospholipase L1-like esterase
MFKKLILSLAAGSSLINAAPIAKQTAEPLLPPVIYATPGVEMNVYFTNIVLYDNLKNLKFKVTCKTGAVKVDRWTLNPTTKQAGTYQFTITVSKQGKKIGTAQSKLVIAPADAGKDKKIKLLIVGDSLTHNSIYSNRLAALLSKPGNPQWKMLGTHKYNKKTGVVHEGYGGWTWNRFATHYESKPNGTYKKMSSPFIFLDKSGKPYLDFARYIKEKCNGQKPDYITILLGINDCFSGSRNPDKLAEGKYKSMFKYADILLKEFRKVCPEATIGVCITPPANSSQKAFLANYKGKYNREPWHRVQFELDKRIIKKFSNREKENIYLIPVELNLDITKGFPGNKNAVHPNHFGYNQIGDSMYSWLKAMLNR